MCEINNMLKSVTGGDGCFQCRLLDIMPKVVLCMIALHSSLKCLLLFDVSAQFFSGLYGV